MNEKKIEIGLMDDIMDYLYSKMISKIRKIDLFIFFS
jgi:hypothetical protein